MKNKVAISGVDAERIHDIIRVLTDEKGTVGEKIADARAFLQGHKKKIKICGLLFKRYGLCIQKMS